MKKIFCLFFSLNVLCTISVTHAADTIFVRKSGLPVLKHAESRIINMQGFPQCDEDFAKGVSACFAGMIDKDLLMAGGCNFPGIPAKDGGTKKYYQDIYVAKIVADSVLSWRKVGQLPQATAYGVSVSTPDGIVCVGGMGITGALNKVYRIRLEGDEARIESLPSLPCTLDNMTGALLGAVVYVAGGNKNGVPCNDLYRLDLNHLSLGWQKLLDFPGDPRVQAVSAVQYDESGKLAFYLWGGFAASANGRQASLSIDGMAYSPISGQWSILPIPLNSDEDTISLGGGVSSSLSDSLILCMGGVHKDVFLQALRKPTSDYLLHPAEWYCFNPCMLVYNTRQRRWCELARTPNVARAGAALVFDGQGYININGELKPGIRTPAIVRILLRSY